MSEYNDNRRPETIESDIERTREDFSSTIDAIQSKLTPGQLMDQAVNYARTSLPADFGANLGNAIRDNPVPVALIGIGIAWLAASGRNSDGRARARRLAMDDDRDLYAGDAGYEAVYGADLAADESLDTTPEGRMHAAAAKARDMKDRVSETGRHLKSKASDIGHGVGDKTSELAGRARDMTHNARDRMSDVGHRSQERYHRAKDSFGHMIDEQPLLLGALGAAIGTLLGATLPATRREDAMMGRTRDDLLDKAKETAREQADTVKESARRVAQVAKEEAGKAANKATADVRSQAQGDGKAGGPTVTPATGAPEVPPAHGLH